MLDFLKQLRDQGESMLRDGSRKAINAALGSDAVLSAINAQVKNYATVHDLALTDEGIQIRAQLLGSRDIFTATAIGIDIDSTNKTFKVQSFKSDMPWADHALNDFAVNRDFSLASLPQMAISTLAGINHLYK